MNDAPCFSKDQLRSYLLGGLSEEVSDQVASHVEHCIDCESTISELDLASDTLIESLRSPAARDDVAVPDGSAVPDGVAPDGLKADGSAPVGAAVPEESVSVYRLAATRARSLWKQAETAGVNDSAASVTCLPRLRDYELIEPLARGGMGTVYRARHQRLNRLVALKVLPQRWLKNPAVVARFEREMKAVGSLRHPAIIQATDGGEADGVHFLVMELIDGLDGSDVVAQLGRLPVSDACEIARQAALGMLYVHQQGIIHRDLKPSNIMVTSEGEVKVLDLGLARVVGEQIAGDELTTVGQLMGTLDFMAPEQLENSHEVDERTDIYSLGATLYKLLTANSPHKAESDEPLVSKLRRIASEPALPIKQRRNDAPEELCDLVDRMLSRSPELRPGSMQAVAEALDPLCGSSHLAKRVKEAKRLRAKNGPPTASPLVGGNALVSAVQSPPLNGVHHRWSPVMPWITGAALLLVAIMGVVISLQTSAGQLVIETASPDVEVRVLKAKKPHTQLKLSRNAETLRLGAGDYEIEIVSDSDGLEIQGGTFTLKRGETWLAKIVHRSAGTDRDGSREQSADQAAIGLLGQQTVATPRQPTFDGKTRDQWIALLRTERSVKQVYEACRALMKLVGDRGDDRDVVDAVLVASRFHDAGTFHNPNPNSEVSLFLVFEDVLERCNPSRVLDGMTKELDGGRSIGFVLNYLSIRSERIRSLIDDPLLAQVQRIATDKSSVFRSEGLDAFSRLGPEESVKRVLVAALSDKAVGVRFFAASTLIDLESHTEEVVTTLAAIVASGETNMNRARAAWLLGDLGSEAMPATQALTECLQEEDRVVAMAAAYEPPSITNAEFPVYKIGAVSVKDAAARALAKIGDDSVVPVLIAEWRVRVSGLRDRATKPAWESGGLTRANTYSPDWISDAINVLVGRYPKMVRTPDGSSELVWHIGDESLTRIYRAVFAGSFSLSVEDPLDLAEKLMPFATSLELEHARISISVSAGKFDPEQLELEFKLIDLLSKRDDSQRLLRAVLIRWQNYHAQRVFWRTHDRGTMNAGFHTCADRIIHKSDDWKTTMIPFLFQCTYENLVPATQMLASFLKDMPPEQQVLVVATFLQKFAPDATWGYGDSPQIVAVWLSDGENSASLLQQAGAMSDTGKAELINGMMRFTHSDKLTEQLVKDIEFVDCLIASLSDDSGLSALILGLLENSCLDEIVTGTEASPKDDQVSIRAAKFLPLLSKVPEAHQPMFTEMLGRLQKSGKNGESEAAGRVLEQW